MIQLFSKRLWFIGLMTFVIGWSSVVFAKSQVDHLQFSMSSDSSVVGSMDSSLMLSSHDVDKTTHVHNLNADHSMTQHDQEHDSVQINPKHIDLSKCHEQAPQHDMHSAMQSQYNQNDVGCHNSTHNMSGDCQQCSQLHCQIQLSFFEPLNPIELVHASLQSFSIYNGFYRAHFALGFAEDILRPPKNLT